MFVPKASSASMASSVPIVILAFNNPTYVRAMLEQLSDRGLHNTVVLDNASTALAMESAFTHARAVVRLSENHGPHYLFSHDHLFDALPEVFCLTDPDLGLNADLPANFIDELHALTEKFGIGKAGFSLDISDWRDMRDIDFKNGTRTCKIWEWEQQFWQDQIGSTDDGDPIYRATVDTTFALYNKRYFDRKQYFEAIRLAGRYTARHLPWYRETKVPIDELRYYAGTQKYSTYSTGYSENSE